MSKRIIIYLIFIYLLVELVLRVSFPVPELSNFDRINYLMLNDEGRKYRHQRDQNWFWQSQLDTPAQFVHNMNRYGFRDREWSVAKSPLRKRVLFIGDSFVEGIMVGQNESIPAHFDHFTEKRFDVMNGGMLGTGINSYLQLAADMLPIFQPDELVLCLSSNDLTDAPVQLPKSRLSTEWFNQLRPRLAEIIIQLLNDSPLKFRWLSSSKSYIPDQSAKSSPWKKDEKQLSMQVTAEIAAHMKAGTLSPFRVNNLYNESVALKKVPQFEPAIQWLAQLCRDQRVNLRMVYIPGRNLLTRRYLEYEKQLCMKSCNEIDSLTGAEYRFHQTYLSRLCAESKVPFLNLSPALQAAETKSAHFWNYDDHMRSKGYALCAKEIADWLKQSPNE